MAYAKIVITQDGVSGAAGVARDDITIYPDTGAEVTLSNGSDGDVGVSTWEWTLIESPPGSTVAIIDPTSQNAKFRPDVYGRYVISLRVNGLADATSGYARSVIGCRHASVGTDVDGDSLLDWLPPAATEGFDANWSANVHGAQPEIVAAMRQLRTRMLPMRWYEGHPHVMSIEIPLTRTVSTNNAIYQLSGYTPFLDTANYPWIVEAAFYVVMGAPGGAGDDAYASLYDETNGAVVVEPHTSDTIKDLIYPVTVGSAAGNLRNDGNTRYSVNIRCDPGGGGDTAEIYAAYILLGAATFVPPPT